MDVRPPVEQRVASLSTAPPAEVVKFPGAHRSAYTETLTFLKSDAAIPTYRVLDRDGAVIRPDDKPDVRERAATASTCTDRVVRAAPLAGAGDGGRHLPQDGDPQHDG
jgi:hypothetical protein